MAISIQIKKQDLPNLVQRGAEIVSLILHVILVLLTSFLPSGRKVNPRMRLQLCFHICNKSDLVTHLSRQGYVHYLVQNYCNTFYQIFHTGLHSKIWRVYP